MNILEGSTEKVYFRLVSAKDTVLYYGKSRDSASRIREELRGMGYRGALHIRRHSTWTEPERDA
jgi:hypothetical protein